MNAPFPVTTAAASKRRRFLITMPSLDGGGAERVVALLASAFALRGHDVHMVTDRAADANRSALDPAVRLTVLGGNRAEAVLRLARLLRRERPDVALSALEVSNLQLAVAAGIARTGTPLVLTHHGYHEGRTGRLSALAYRLMPWLSRAARLQVAVSRDLARHLVERWGAAPARMTAVHNPIRLPETGVARNGESLKARAPVVLALGRLVPDKGFADLIQAFARVPDRDARLVILGEGPERHALTALAARLGVAGRVALPGYAAEPWPYFAEARVLAVASHHETFGNVVVEGLAHGLPVVATDCGGPREIMDRPGLGELVPVGDVASLGQALARALQDPGDPLPRLARAEGFALGTVAARYLALVEDAIAGREPGRAA